MPRATSSVRFTTRSPKACRSPTSSRRGPCWTGSRSRPDGNRLESIEGRLGEAQRTLEVEAAWLSATAVVGGLAIYSLLSSFGYPWVAIALALVAAGIRVNGVVAGTNVLRGLPRNRTSIGAALVDTASEVASAVGIAVTGTILAALFTGAIATPGWSGQQAAEFQDAVRIAGLALTVVAAALVGFGILRTRSLALDRSAEAAAA